MKKIAFVTSEEDPDLISDDQLAMAPLHSLGYTVCPLVWDRKHPPFESFDALIFRSCWNYHRKYPEFLAWLQTVRNSRVPTFNPIDRMLWNLDKSYLLELASKGARIPRTTLVSPNFPLNQGEIRKSLDEVASDQAVIKPAVSLNGQDTYLIPCDDIQEICATVGSILSSDRAVLIQEYIPEIRTSGEISLIFFNGEYSHAIRKTPALEEFRVQSEYGGRRSPVSPDIRLISQAREILSWMGQPLLYSRVDLIETLGGGVLIELEIIDPMLFLGNSSGAPERFACAVARCLN